MVEEHHFLRNCKVRAETACSQFTDAEDTVPSAPPPRARPPPRAGGAGGSPCSLSLVSRDPSVLPGPFWVLWQGVLLVRERVAVSHSSNTSSHVCTLLHTPGHFIDPPQRQCGASGAGPTQAVSRRMHETRGVG